MTAIDERFGATAFQRASSPQVLADDLAALLTARLVQEPAEKVVRAAVQELRAVGHPLASFDESDDFAIWYAEYPNQHRFVVEFSYRDDKPAVVRVTFAPIPTG